MILLLIAKNTGCIYELTNVIDDKLHLHNLSTGQHGVMEIKDFDKLSIHSNINLMNQKNNNLLKLIKELNLKHDDRD